MFGWFNDSKMKRPSLQQRTFTTIYQKLPGLLQEFLQHKGMKEVSLNLKQRPFK